MLSGVPCIAILPILIIYSTRLKAGNPSFTGDNFNRVKGEAIALRALFHFDLARMYGQSPVTGMNVKAIPYIRNFGVRSTPFSTLQNALDSCIADLGTAKDLLANTDTSAVLKAVNDPFTSYTQNHMNYWAVQALMARVYLYKGDRDNADKYAKAVIGSNKFPLITSNVAAANNPIRDRTFSQEHVFSSVLSNIKTNNLILFDKSAGTRFACCRQVRLIFILPVAAASTITVTSHGLIITRLL